MHINKYRDATQSLVTVVMAALLLAACSGGGGNSSENGSKGSASLSLFAGNMGGLGNVNGTGTAARFFIPSGVATDSAGNVFVADSGNNIIRKISPTGEVTTLAGTAGASGSDNGTGAAARFNYPTGIATDSTGNIYVADNNNYTIRKVTPVGVVTTLAGTAGVSGSDNGIGAAARFNPTSSLATDSSGNVFVADSGNNTIRKITPARVVTTLADLGNCNPSGVATDSAGNIFVSGNNIICMITSAGVVTTLAGKAGVPGSVDGTGTAARFFMPGGITTDTAGNVYVSDNRTIRKITPAGAVTTLAGTAGAYGTTDGVGAAAGFDIPTGVASDSAGNIYVADTGNTNIRKITPAGVVTTLAGAAEIHGSADGIGTAAIFSGPGGIATDKAGNVYVADFFTDNIRKITSAGVVTTLAVAVAGPSDIIGNHPAGVATDSVGNVYVAETFKKVILKITPGGVVTTLVGTDAGLSSPGGVVTDSAGNVYVADTGNCAILKITQAGVVTTMAAMAASSICPFEIAIDSAGNLYVTDNDNATIGKITPAGVITTLAGKAGVPGSADGNGTTARFNSPYGITVDSVGNVYVADGGNNTIRKITPAGVVTTVVGVPGQKGFIAGALPGGLSSPVGVAISGTSLYITTENGVVVVHDVP